MFYYWLLFFTQSLFNAKHCDNCQLITKVCFNQDCVELLLQNGADPRIEDSDGTTAFELAKNDEIRSILHDAIIQADKKREEAGTKWNLNKVLSFHNEIYFCLWYYIYARLNLLCTVLLDWGDFKL